jgi:hypothetical protein
VGEIDPPRPQPRPKASHSELPAASSLSYCQPCEPLVVNGDGVYANEGSIPFARPSLRLLAYGSVKALHVALASIAFCISCEHLIETQRACARSPSSSNRLTCRPGGLARAVGSRGYGG